MANLKSSKKDIRRIAVRTARNNRDRSRLKTLRKNLAAAAEAGGEEKTRAATIAFISALDKAAKRKIIHSNKANRLKSVYAADLKAASNG